MHRNIIVSPRDQHDVARAIYVAPHRKQCDIPAGIVTFGKLGIATLLVVSKPHLEQISTREWVWNSLELLPIAADDRGRVGPLRRLGTSTIRKGE